MNKESWASVMTDMPEASSLGSNSRDSEMASEAEEGEEEEAEEEEAEEEEEEEEEEKQVEEVKQDKEEEEAKKKEDEVEVEAEGTVDASCRAVRSSFLSQDDMKVDIVDAVGNSQEIVNDVGDEQQTADAENRQENIDVTSKPNAVSSGLDKNLKGIWKDEWVASLIHLRGSMNDEFNKPQKSGLDVWSRLTAQMTETHKGFDKNSESCRKKWQRIYKQFRDSKALLSTSNGGGNKQSSCKWFDLVDHYMHNQAVPTNVNTKCEDMGPSITLSPRGKNPSKRARRDQKIKESLSQMVETWRESLEVLKDSEAKRLATLQRLNGTMTGLLDILRK